MNYPEAILTHQYVRRPNWDEGSAFCYYAPRTGPYKNLVECDYFVVLDGGLLSFSTTGPDLYAQDLLATDFEVLAIPEQEIQEAYEKTQALDGDYNA